MRSMGRILGHSTALDHDRTKNPNETVHFSNMTA
ncbi:predicted protein [Streptomyces filamentosus NRRL 15998]|uniref:Predicted protein n=1 Tax=Streptomyces filamentosus NRRL 15998 TaxID=457431 RepID=D6AJ80_STRFL|nr:predicted protein [Streptomyces filamentosus NRRL 15998]